MIIRLMTAVTFALISFSAASAEGLGSNLAASATNLDVQSADAEDELREQIFGQVLDRSFPAMSLIWPTSRIPVCWESLEDSSAEDRQVVRQAVQRSWEAHSALEFTGWAQCEADYRGIRISVSDVGPHTKGLGSTLDGMPNGMVLNFSFDNWSKSCSTSEGQRLSCIYTIAVHEFGHALGFAHEQNRIDTPDSHCFDRKQGSDGDTLLTPWDPSSVMNYCNPVYNNNGILSKMDAYSVSLIYGKP